MRKFIIICCSIIVFFGLTVNSDASIIWDWEFGTEAGQFVTDGDLVSGSVNPGIYNLLDFSVSSTVLDSSYIGSISGGAWDYFETNPPYALDWNGTAVNEWKNSGSSIGYSYWGFQNMIGIGIKRYYFGMEVEQYNLSYLNPVWIAPEWASLIAAETYPPTPPGTYVSIGTVDVSPSGTTTPIPETATMLLFGLGLLGLAGIGRRKK
jgi:hypothetical protein